jgi:hypothetical protein
MDPGFVSVFRRGYPTGLVSASALEKRQEEYVQSLRRLEERGIDLAAFYPGNMKMILGNSGTSAVMFYLGRDSFLNPTVLVGRLYRLFGVGAFSLLDGMIARAVAVKDFRSPSPWSSAPLRQVETTP